MISSVTNEANPISKIVPGEWLRFRFELEDARDKMRVDEPVFSVLLEPTRNWEWTVGNVTCLNNL